MPKANITTSQPSAVNKAVKSAADWFLKSGIQNTGDDPKFSGGVNAWYDLEKESYSFLYGEITGYVVNAFLFFHSILENPIHLQRAQLAADWLIRVRDKKYGLVPNRVYEITHYESYYDSWVFTFDQWMIIFGLCNLSSVTKNQTYLTHAQEIADFLIAKTFKDDGYMYPVFNLQNGQAEATDDQWSRQAGSFHAKALMGLNLLHALTGNEKYLEYAVRLAKRSVQDQTKDGRFVTQTNEKSTHLHPHSYTLEGLLYFALLQNNQNLIEVVQKGFEWALNSQLSDGGIHCFYKNGSFLPYVRVDVLAQTLRLSAIMLKQVPACHKFRLKLDRLKDKLLAYQLHEGPQKGGFFYGQNEKSIINRHLNAWVTMFAAQALWLYEQPQIHDNQNDFGFFV